MMSDGKELEKPYANKGMTRPAYSRSRPEGWGSMITKLRLKELIEYKALPGSPTLSVYLNIDQSDAVNLNRMFEVSLFNVLRDMQETLDNRQLSDFKADAISRRIDQSDRARFRFELEQLDQIVFMLEFLMVTMAELIPLLRIMPEPPSQFRARGDFLHPHIYPGL
jgi:hypothetical protein